MQQTIHLPGVLDAYSISTAPIGIGELTKPEKKTLSNTAIFIIVVTSVVIVLGVGLVILMVCEGTCFLIHDSWFGGSKGV